MKFSIRFADKIVGSLVVLALAMLVVVVFMLGRSQRWFKYDYQYNTFFVSANGLSKNMAVQYKGFTIGHVKDFRLADDDRVQVIFTIFEEYRDRWVKEGSVVELVASPIGLGNSFFFYPGLGVNILDEGSLIPAFNSEEGKKLMAQGIATRTDSGDSINAILNNVNSVLESVNLSLSGAEGSEDLPIGKILNDISKLINNVSNVIEDIDNVIEGVADPNSSIMRTLDGDGPVYTEITSMLSSLSGILDDLNRTTTVIPAQLPVMLSDLTIILRDLQDVLVSISNNPLLRGGIPERAETSPGGASQRDLEF